MLLHINGMFNGKIEIISFVVKFRSCVHGLLKNNEKKPAQFFNFTLCYKDDSVLSLNNSRFGDFVDRIYPIELEIKETTIYSICRCCRNVATYKWNV
jgi:hypothetical protein